MPLITSASLYEQLFPLTTVMKQRVVENFSADALDTNRWTTVNNNGSNTFAMSDESDGGFKITTGATSGNHGAITFNQKRQYSPTAAVCIGIMKFDNSTNTAQLGLANVADNILTGTDQSTCRFSGISNAINLTTGDASTYSATNSSVTSDTSYHSIKIENGSSDIKLTLDGSLQVTKTTNRPTAKQQPFFAVRTGENVANDANIRYIEAYNV